MLKYILYISFTLFGMTLVKLDNHKMYINISNNSFDLSLGIKAILGMLFYGIGFFLWMSILKNNKFVYIFPITFTLLNLLTVVIGILVFKEALTMKIIIGIVVSITGIIIMNI
ncbi:hypothetical protein [Peptoanaerobacter stomatis]|uniref:hypothetical protein n=1 Tax=Peptoanaerobacter stomatis TaxID=796937 RepID=UPI003F9ECF0F